MIKKIPIWDLFPSEVMLLNYNRMKLFILLISLICIVESIFLIFLKLLVAFFPKITKILNAFFPKITKILNAFFPEKLIKSDYKNSFNKNYNNPIVIKSIFGSSFLGMIFFYIFRKSIKGFMYVWIKLGLVLFLILFINELNAYIISLYSYIGIALKDRNSDNFNKGIIMLVICYIILIPLKSLQFLTTTRLESMEHYPDLTISERQNIYAKTIDLFLLIFDAILVLIFNIKPLLSINKKLPLTLLLYSIIGSFSLIKIGYLINFDEVILRIFQRILNYGSELIPFIILYKPIFKEQMNFKSFYDAELYYHILIKALFYIIYNIEKLYWYKITFKGIKYYQGNIITKDGFFIYNDE